MKLNKSFRDPVGKQLVGWITVIVVMNLAECEAIPQDKILNRELRSIDPKDLKPVFINRDLKTLHETDFAFLPLVTLYAIQNDELRNLTGTKLAAVVKAHRGDCVIAMKAMNALDDRPSDQFQFISTLGGNILPEVQKLIVHKILEWWESPAEWNDKELYMLTSSGDPLLIYMPQYIMKILDDELADRLTTILGRSPDIKNLWSKKPMEVKKSWFELAKNARYFGAVHDWSFQRMQKLSFLLQGASPVDLEVIPQAQRTKGLVISNPFTELQARVVFDAFYKNPPLSQESLQEFQRHILSLTPSQLQRFEIADSFLSLEDMMRTLESSGDSSYSTLLQIANYMWPLSNTTMNAKRVTVMSPTQWQIRELSQIGKMIFLLPKSYLFQIPQRLIHWNSAALHAMRSSHLSRFQIWHITSLILNMVNDRLKPDYLSVMPDPFQKGVPAHNISQALFRSPVVSPEITKILIEQADGMLPSQLAVIAQKIRPRLSDTFILRNIISSPNPSRLLSFFSPRHLQQSMIPFINAISEMPERGKFGFTEVHVKTLPHSFLSLWLRHVRTTEHVNRWSAEDLLGKSPMGVSNKLHYAILGLSCADVQILDNLEILPVLQYYRHELMALRNFKSSLRFNLDLRPCVLEKILEYLAIKEAIVSSNEVAEIEGSGLEEEGIGEEEPVKEKHLFSQLELGEVKAIGGELLCGIPLTSLAKLRHKTQILIFEEIGKLSNIDLLIVNPLKRVHWYANELMKLLRDQEAGETLSFKMIHNMGNLLFYLNTLESNAWAKSYLKGILQSKNIKGAKTVCLTSSGRNSWFEYIRATFGEDLSTWTEYDLVDMGDLLISVPLADLSKIPTASFSKGFNTLMQQSGFFEKIVMPGEYNEETFVSLCNRLLKGEEGQRYEEAFRALMKRWFEGAQALVNTVKTTDELIQDGMDRTGRLPRSIQSYAFNDRTHGRHRRQVDSSFVPPTHGHFPRPGQHMFLPGAAPQPQVISGVNRQNPQNSQYPQGPSQYQNSPSQFGTRDLSSQATQQQSFQQPGSGQTFSQQGIPAHQPIPTSGQVPNTQFPQQHQFQIPSQQQQGNPVHTQRPISSAIAPPTAIGGPRLHPGQESSTGTGIAGQEVQPQQTAGSFSRPVDPGLHQHPQQRGLNPAGHSFSFGPASAPIHPHQHALRPQSGHPSAPGSPSAPLRPHQQALNPQTGLPNSPGSPPPFHPHQHGLHPQSGHPLSQGPSSPALQHPHQQGLNPQSGLHPIPSGASFGSISPHQSDFDPNPQTPGLAPTPQHPHHPLAPGNPNAPVPGKSAGPGQTVPVQDSPDEPREERLRSLATQNSLLLPAGRGQEISCFGIKTAGKAAIGLDLKDIEKLPAQDLFDCIEDIGKVEWDLPMKKEIINILKKKLNLQSSKLNAITLIELGNLVTAIPVVEKGAPNENDTDLNLATINFTVLESLDNLSILGNQISQPAVLKTLASRFNEDNQLFPAFTKAAVSNNLRAVVFSLQNILCGLSDKMVNSILESDPTLFLDVSTALGRLRGCDQHVLSTLANHAVRPVNYGPPRAWSTQDVEAMGVVIAGLKPDILATIPPASISGLQPNAIHAFSDEALSFLTEEQIRSFSYNAAKAITSSQLVAFNSKKLDALNSVLISKDDDIDFTSLADVEAAPDDSSEDEEAIVEVEEVNVEADEPIDDLEGRSIYDSEMPETSEESSTENYDDDTPQPESEDAEEAPSDESSSSKIAINFNFVISLFSFYIAVTKLIT